MHPFWGIDLQETDWLPSVDAYYIFDTSQGRYSSSDLPFARPFAHDHRAEAHRQRGEFASAAADLEYVLNSLPLGWRGRHAELHDRAVPRIRATVRCRSPLSRSCLFLYCQLLRSQDEPWSPAIDWFLQDVRFSCFNGDLAYVHHPLSSDEAPNYDAFYYILGRGRCEQGRIEESLYCFRWIRGYRTYWRKDAWTDEPPIDIDADLWHSHVLRLSGRYDEAASCLADCLGAWPFLTDELLAELALLVVTAPEVWRLFGLGGCFSGVRFAPRLASILQESKPWVRESLAWAFRSLLVQDRALRVAGELRDAVPAMDLLHTVRDSDTPTKELVSKFTRFARDWLGEPEVLIRDALQASVESIHRTEERVEASQRPVRWLSPCYRLGQTAPGLEIVFAAHALEVTALSFSPGSDRLLTGSLDGSVGLWDVKGPGLACRAVPQRGRPVADVAFSPDGRLVAVAAGSAVVLYDPQLERAVTTLHHAFDVERLLWAPVGESILTLSNDVLRRWNVDRASVVDEHGWTPRDLFRFACSPAGLVACAGRSYWYHGSEGWYIEECGPTHTLMVDGQEILEVELPGLESHGDREYEDALMPGFPLTFLDDATLIAVFDDGLYPAMKSRTWRNIGGRWVEHADDKWVMSDYFYGEGQVGRNEAGDLFLAAVSEEGRGQAVFRICPLTRCSRVPSLTFGQETGVCEPGSRIVVSPDGRRLATSTRAGAVAIWDLGLLLKSATER